MLLVVAANSSRAGNAADTSSPTTASPPVVVGSKQFTESVILGEMVVQAIRAGGDDATHRQQLGGTRIVYGALQRGEIDVYPEYTGTLRQEIFAGRDAATDDDLRRLLREDGIVMSKPLGFNNSYALAAPRDLAERLGVATISDLARRPELRLGLSNEFLDRGDGWQNLRQHYGLPHEARGMVHEFAYQQLKAGAIDVTDVYTTDAQLAESDLVVLKDDRDYFPSYDAVLLMRADLEERYPRAARQIALLESQLDERDVIQLNALVQSGEANESQAAAQFLTKKSNIAARAENPALAARIWRSTLEHLALVGQSLTPAILVAVPLGVLAAKLPRVGRVILGVVGIVQTIPALALLVLLMAPVAFLRLDTLGAGSATAIAALFLYSLLPVVQNTATGLATIPPEYRESAAALGLSPRFRLLRIELPLASPSILAGVKTAAVLNVGFATLGALVGAGGYGQPILSGIRLDRTALILEGAVPAACLAILLQVAFEVGERWLLPAGLRTIVARKGDESNH